MVDAEGSPTGELLLPLVPSIDSFGSMKDLWSSFPTEFRSTEKDTLDRFDAYVQASQNPAGHGSAGPSLALRRRISRESGPATRAIELGATLVLEGLRRGNHRTIHVPFVDEIDGLSLRLFVRAVVLMTEDHDLVFVFHSTADPRSSATHRTMSVNARQSVLANAVHAGRFEVEVRSVGELPARQPVDPSIDQAAVDLVAHNYEGALLRTESAVGRDAVDGARIAALAAVNLGDFDAAEAALNRAMGMTRDGGVGAHLYCLLALIAAKRTGDLAASEEYINLGLEALDSMPTDADPDVERAWLLNARALNRALVFRDTRDDHRFREAHELEVEASRLVSKGASPERTYLRFNLLANLAFLWEGRGEPMNAAKVFEKAFAERAGVDGVSAATLGYRLAVLYAKAGDLTGADEVLQGLDDDLPVEEWFAVDHLLRARARIALQADQFELAESLASRGMEIGFAARSADAVRNHGPVLAEVLRRTGRDAAAAAVESRMVKVGIEPTGSITISTLRPKLPAYIPEIDLEDVPSSDTNRRLAGV